MDFNKKINALRPHNPQKSVQGSLESDRGRIINSAALRRLQQKTQVFPLERNAAVRSRLTHSLEVQQNGRYIAQTIVKELKKQKLAPELYDDLATSLESLVEMACLMHDIGNPAFGHFGEAAINDWFKRYLSQHPAYALDMAQLSSHKYNENVPLKTRLLFDLCNFEGNAQAIRIIHTLSSLNLTYCQTASILKYTRCATQPKPPLDSSTSYLQKKVGYYYSEQQFVNELCNALHIKVGHRHPAAYIMEAADDIAYCLADIEDAVEKGFISVDTLRVLLAEEYQSILSTLPPSEQIYKQFVTDKCTYAYERACENLANFDNEFFIWLRVGLIHTLVKHAATRFIGNLEAVYHGSFNSALLEDQSYQYAITQTLKNVALKHVFCHKEVEELELQGYKITSGILDEYRRLLELDAHQFMQIINKDRGFPIETRLLNRMSPKFVAIYKQTINQLTPEQTQHPIFEFYYRSRLLQDFLSGMTDQFAYDTYRTLVVAD